MNDQPIFWEEIILAKDLMKINAILRMLVSESIFNYITPYKDSVIRRTIEKMKNNYSEKVNSWEVGEKTYGKYQFYYRYFPSQVMQQYRYNCYVCGEKLNEEEGVITTFFARNVLLYTQININYITNI